MANFEKTYIGNRFGVAEQCISKYNKMNKTIKHSISSKNFSSQKINRSINISKIGSVKGARLK